ncbi:UNVERIFIED_CONTAM: hypothetical protein Slati_4147800 [Sesamum latifolium]|uniref:Myb/SANT-like domain-containing protein n=1 Tax=Sesamum latifolium TaxID=2727402 RepID=A0AAW2T9J6_9LAMI
MSATLFSLGIVCLLAKILHDVRHCFGYATGSKSTSCTLPAIKVMSQPDEEGSSKQRRRGGMKDKASTRRAWSNHEEEVLINGLKSIVSSGWKCDNGFRNGYLTHLENFMARALPNCEIKADPHITSKIQIDPNAKNMRFKSWPYFGAWREIFGKDRATGDSARDPMEFSNKVQEEERNDEGDCYIPIAEWNPKTGFASIEEEAPSNSNLNVDPTINSSSATKRASSSSRKRKAEDPLAALPQLVQVVTNFCDSANNRIGTLTRVLEKEFGDPDQRALIFTDVKQLNGLDENEQLHITNRLVNRPKDMEMYFSLPKESREKLVRLMLSGRF